MADCYDDCGEPGTTVWRHSDDEVFWTRCPLEVVLCSDCWTRRDNREPAEPDGEAFRGGEAEAYWNEQMAQWQKLK